MESGTWYSILSLRKKHEDFMSMLKRQRRKRRCHFSHTEEKTEENGVGSNVKISFDISIEKQLMEKLLSPVLVLPVTGLKLLQVKEGTDVTEKISLALEKLETQNLVTLQHGGTCPIITGVNLDRLSRIAEAIGLTGRVEGLPQFVSVQEELDWLLNAPSLRDRENRRVGVEIQELLNAKSFKEQLMLEKFQSVGGSQLREFCPHKTREDCRRSSGSGRACPRLHFRKIIQSHTDEGLGDCSFLNTCFHLETCKFVHYTIDTTQETEPRQRSGKSSLVGKNPGIKLKPAEWINCDIRSLDMAVLGKFSVIMADPPWDIHMELPYGNYLLLYIT